MYQKSSKRRQIIARTLVYALMTISVLTIVTVLVLVILGYSFNRKDGRIEQGGLLQFASIPSDVFVTLDEQAVGTRTPTKASVATGSHSVRMDLNGYRTWRKTINVEAGGIGWLSYARLIPDETKPESLRTFTSVAGSLASPNRNWIVVQEDAASPNLALVNIESDTPKYTPLVIPESLLVDAQTTAPQSFSLESWGNDDDFVLIKRMYDTDKVEWLVIDRGNPTNSVNLTTMFGISASAVEFGGRSARDLYVLTDGVVRRVNLDDKTLSIPLVENVETFSIYQESTVVYVTRPDANNQRHTGYRQSDMERATTVFSYAADVPGVHLSLEEYFGKKYVLVTHGTEMEVYSGTLPNGEIKAKLKREASATLATPAIRATITDNGRFAVAQIADGYVTYDVELKKTDATTFKNPTSAQRDLQWLDDYMIWSDRGGMLRFYEFDGANQQDIMPVAEGQAVTLTGNNKYVYGLAPVENGIALQRTKLILN